MNFISHILNKICSKNFTGGYRKDYNTQEKIQKAVDKDRKVKINDVQSSRWKYGRGNDYLDPNTVAEKDNAKGNSNTNITEKAVSSSAVQSVSYDPTTKDLGVTFVGGNTEYTYPDVPKEVFTEFMDSPSKGRYVNNVLKPEYAI